MSLRDLKVMLTSVGLGLFIVTAALLFAQSCESGKQETSESKPADESTGTAEKPLIDENQEQSLKGKLEARKEQFIEQAPPEVADAFQRGIDEVWSTGIEDSALAVGDQAVMFILPDATGDSISLEKLLAEGPVILTWYRGGWCPYCNLELRAYQELLPKINDLGAQLVAVSPEQPDSSLATSEKLDLQYHVLSDLGNQVAKKYKIVFELPEETSEIMSSMIDLSAYNSDSSGELPIPATFVIDQDGIIRYAYVDSDYRRRAEPAEVLEAIEQLK